VLFIIIKCNKHHDFYQTEGFPLHLLVHENRNNEKGGMDTIGDLPGDDKMNMHRGRAVRSF
jgi:hypothetical protein